MIVPSGVPRPLVRLITLCRTAVVSSFALAATVPPARAETGQWTPWVDWSGGVNEKYAVHMVLMPSDDHPYTAKILWFHGEKTGPFWGGLWGWKAGSDGCGAYPSASFVSLPVPSLDVDIFCSGHALVGDRPLIAGGTDPVTQQYGDDRTRRFTAGSCGASNTWSDPGPMAKSRWYPSTSVLRDSRIMVLSGKTAPYHRFFGGLRDGFEPATGTGDSLYLFAPVRDGRWDPAMLPDADPSNGLRPDPRKGHTVVDMTASSHFGKQVYFGGRGPDSTSANVFRDTWFLRREPNTTGADYRYVWEEKNIDPPLPPQRSEHTAVMALDSMMVI